MQRGPIGREDASISPLEESPSVGGNRLLGSSPIPGHTGGKEGRPRDLSPWHSVAALHASASIVAPTPAAAAAAAFAAAAFVAAVGIAAV